MSDEGLHEIQLNGKQLVFLFMTATVVAVVIFLCGVMVGRGVPLQRGAPVIVTEGADPTAPDAARASTSGANLGTTSSSAGGPAASPASQEKLSYPARLEQPEPVTEHVQESGGHAEPFKPTTAVAKVPAPSASPSVTQAVATAPKTSRPEAKPDPRGKNKTELAKSAVSRPEPAERAGDPAGAGFVVQVTAVKVRSDAEAIRARLVKKGYPAFITSAGTAGSPLFRVRVGKYESRRDADTAAGKLERDEQFKPWVTR